MKDRSLQYPLKAQSWLGFTLVIMLWNQWCRGVNKFLKVVTQFIEAGSAGAQNRCGRFIVQQG